MTQLDPEFVETVTDVARLLGMTVVPDPERTYVGVFLVDDAGRRIFMRRAYQDKDKLAVSGDYPGDHYDLQAALRRLNVNRVPAIENPSIRVTLSRGPDIIRREIERRFLNAFTTIHDAVVQVALDNAGDTNARHKAAKHLCTLLPGTSLNLDREDSKATSTEIRWYNSTNDVADGYGDIVLNHDASKAGLVLKSVPLDVVERVFKALAES